MAHNIARAWTGRGEPRQFTGEGMCFIETGGGRAGIGKVLYEKYWLFGRF